MRIIPIYISFNVCLKTHEKLINPKKDNEMTKPSRQYASAAVNSLVGLAAFATATFADPNSARAQESHANKPLQFTMEIANDPTNVGAGTRSIDLNCNQLGSGGAMTARFAYQADAGLGSDNKVADGSIVSAILHMSSVKKKFDGSASSDGPANHRQCIPAGMAIAMGADWIPTQDSKAFADDTVCPQLAAFRSCLTRMNIDPNAANLISDAYILGSDGNITLDTSKFSRSAGVVFSQQYLER